MWGLRGIALAATLAAATPPAFAEVYTVRVYFEWNSARLDQQASNLVGIWAEQASICQRNGVRIVGHTDGSQPEQRNLELSAQRAEAVRLELVRSGLPTSALIVEARGSSQPAQPAAAGAREALNRRVEILITCP